MDFWKRVFNQKLWAALFGPKSSHGFIFKENSRTPPGGRYIGIKTWLSRKRAIPEHVNVCILKPALWTRIRLCQPALYFLGPSDKDLVMRYGALLSKHSVGKNHCRRKTCQTKIDVLATALTQIVESCRCRDDRNNDVARTSPTRLHRNLGFLGSWKIEYRLPS